MRREKIIESIKKALKSILYPIEGRLYGSEARGDALPYSDTDLLILLDGSDVSNRMENDLFSPLYQIGLSTGILINQLILRKEQWGKHFLPFF